MSDKRDDARILIYSHDSFGLGHLRRSRTIAHALVGANDKLSVLILSGSPIIGSFDFRARVDFVRVPGVIKLRNGEYTSLKLHLKIDQTMVLRGSIIQHTADVFDPDVFIVDKEPLGLRGEVRETLEMLKKRGTHLALGLRDVMDEPAQLRPEWERKNVMPALSELYDDIWVYGLPQFYDPMAGVDIPEVVRRKIVYTGYLRNWVPDVSSPSTLSKFDDPYFLVTAGGGGDGENLIDWVISAYECDRNIPLPSVIVFGPFMHSDIQERFQARIANLPNVEAITFDSHIEHLVSEAAGIVAMGGYNTFCDILSFDKPSLIVPRTKPRMEQYIRAARAKELGLLSMLQYDGRKDPTRMATALRQLTQQRRPSTVILPGLLDGLDNVNRLVMKSLTDRPLRQSALAVVNQKS
ncbi:MAG: glycosyltransferase [Proteobacteria bacterium]|nr:glycosyltransferase [Pseudomonadota bacterium]